MARVEVEVGDGGELLEPCEVCVRDAHCELEHHTLEGAAVAMHVVCQFVKATGCIL